MTMGKIHGLNDKVRQNYIVESTLLCSNETWVIFRVVAINDNQLSHIK